MTVSMKRAFTAIWGIAVFLHANAASVQLPEVEWFDAEVATNIAMQVWRMDDRILTVVVEFDASASNNMPFALGVDADGNGDLSASEADLQLGWDCGTWFASLGSTNLVEFADVPAGHKTLTWKLRLNADGCPREVSAFDGANPILTGMTDMLPVWPTCRGWNIVKVAARGRLSPSARFDISAKPHSLRIILR